MCNTKTEWQNNAVEYFCCSEKRKGREHTGSDPLSDQDVKNGSLQAVKSLHISIKEREVSILEKKWVVE